MSEPFNTGTGCHVEGSGGWCVEAVDCQERCTPSEWRDEFSPYLTEALRDPEVRAAYESEETA